MNIGYLPSAFKWDRKEATSITLKILAREIARRHDVYIFVGKLHDQPGKENRDGVKIIRYSRYYPWNQPNIFLRLASLVTHVTASGLSLRRYRRETPLRLDVLHGWSASEFNILRTLLAKLANGGGVTLHTLKSQSAAWMPRILQKMLISALDGVIVQTEQRKKHLVEDLGVDREKIHLIHSPIDAERFTPTNNQSALKKREGYDGENVILYYGHFNKHKGVEYLIRSLKYVQTADVRLVLIPSSDDASNNYDDIIAQESAQDRIDIKPADTDVVKYLNLADTLVLPYPNLVRTESNPSCLLEGMRCKTPVVTSDLAPLREIVEHEQSALLAKPRSPRSIAHNIDRILTDDELRGKLAARASEIAEAFSHDKIAKEYEKTYATLLEQEN